MKIIEPGHVYQLEHRDGTGAGLLVFVNREAGTEHEGTQTQEILRALIDRTQHCDRCMRWPGNDEIVAALRRALVLHEARALERKTEKGELKPEEVPTGADGHYVLFSGRPVETGWLIEAKPGTVGHFGPSWWTGRGWSTDSTDAIRFCRARDADLTLGRMSEVTRSNAFVSEHQWS